MKKLRFHFHILKFNLNVFCWINERQSISKSAQRRIKPTVKLANDFHDNKFSIMLWLFSDAYLPKWIAMESLVNLPIKNAGIMYNGFILAMPPAKNSGVVGRGNKEYAIIAN